MFASHLDLACAECNLMLLYAQDFEIFEGCRVNL